MQAILSQYDQPDTLEGTGLVSLTADVAATEADDVLSSTGEEIIVPLQAVILDIGANEYYAYADICDADDFLAPDLVRGTNWLALDDCRKAQALVSASRTIDRICWPGKKQDPKQPLQWPRVDLKGVPAELAVAGEIPRSVYEAAMLLAGTLASDSGLADVDGGEEIGLDRVTVGPITLDYAEGASRARAQASEAGALRDPTADSLIKPLRQVAAGERYVAVAKPRAFGTSDESTFAGDPFARTKGFA